MILYEQRQKEASKGSVGFWWHVENVVSNILMYFHNQKTRNFARCFLFGVTIHTKGQGGLISEEKSGNSMELGNCVDLIVPGSI